MKFNNILTPFRVNIFFKKKIQDFQTKFKKK